MLNYDYAAEQRNRERAIYAAQNYPPGLDRELLAVDDRVFISPSRVNGNYSSFEVYQVVAITPPFITLINAKRGKYDSPFTVPLMDHEFYAAELAWEAIVKAKATADA